MEHSHGSEYIPWVFMLISRPRPHTLMSAKPSAKAPSSLKSSWCQAEFECPQLSDQGYLCSRLPSSARDFGRGHLVSALAQGQTCISFMSLHPAEGQAEWVLRWRQDDLAGGCVLTTVTRGSHHTGPAAGLSWPLWAHRGAHVGLSTDFHLSRGPTYFCCSLNIPSRPPPPSCAHMNLLWDTLCLLVQTEILALKST